MVCRPSGQILNSKLAENYLQRQRTSSVFKYNCNNHSSDILGRQVAWLTQAWGRQPPGPVPQETGPQHVVCSRKEAGPSPACGQAATSVQVMSEQLTGNNSGIYYHSLFARKRPSGSPSGE